MSSPCRREAGLVSRSFGAEMIVYDERTNQAHHLSEDAVVVWECCDGVRSPDAIAEECGLTVERVAAAVTELDRCDLLEDGGRWGELFDRRGLLVRAAVLSVPLITSAAIYPALAHASTGPGSMFTLTATISPLSEPISVAFSPDGLLLAVANQRGGSVTVYPVTPGSPDTVSTTATATITGLIGPNSVAFSPDGKLLAVADVDGPVTVYPVTLGSTDTVSTTAVATITSLSEPFSVAFSPDGKLLAVADIDGSVPVYPVTLGSTDTVSTTAVATITGLNDPLSVAFSPDGLLLAVANSGGSVTVYPVTLGSTDTVSTTAVATITTGLNEPASVAFSPDGSLLAVANYTSSGPVNVYLRS